MVGLRLFLPENWTSYPGRMARTRVPADQQAFQVNLRSLLRKSTG